MPNRAAKSRKQLRQKLNAKWAREGRTAKQHKKWKAKNPTKQYPKFRQELVMSIDKGDLSRSYKGQVVGDNMVVSLNLKWLIQIITLAGMLVYGWYRIETRIVELERNTIASDATIKDLLSKHEAVESQKREQLEEKVAFYEKEFNINPLSWGKKKKKK